MACPRTVSADVSLPVAIAVTVAGSKTWLARTLPCVSAQHELRSARAAVSVVSSSSRCERFD
jgi:hypothetical protein